MRTVHVLTLTESNLELEIVGKSNFQADLGRKPLMCTLDDRSPRVFNIFPKFQKILKDMIHTFRHIKKYNPATSMDPRYRCHTKITIKI